VAQRAKLCLHSAGSCALYLAAAGMQTQDRPTGQSASDSVHCRLYRGRVQMTSMTLLQVARAGIVLCLSTWLTGAKASYEVSVRELVSSSVTPDLLVLHVAFVSACSQPCLSLSRLPVRCQLVPANMYLLWFENPLGTDVQRNR